MQYLKKLRTLLRYDLTYYILLLITSIYVLIIINTGYQNSKYNIKTTEINGIIDKIKWDGNHISLIVIGKEKILVNYYYEKYDEYIKDYNTLKLGDIIKLNGSIKKPLPNTNFNLFNYKNYLLSQNVYWIFTADKITYKTNFNIFYSLKNNISTYLNKYSNTYPYMKTFILGDTNELNQEISNLYRDNGISHLLVASGTHITVLSLGLLFVLKRLFKRTLVSYGFTIMFLFLYIFISNFSFSIIRSTLYFVFMFINKTFNLRIKPLNIIIFIMTIILLNNAYSVYDVGFQFTFIITIFLNIYKQKFKRFKNYFAKTFIISLIAFLASIPILININFSINLVSPLINVIFIPLITFIIFPFSILLLIIPIANPLFYYLIKLSEKLLEITSHIKMEITLAHIPLFIIFIYYLLINLFIMGFFSKKIKLLVPFLLLILVHHNITLFNMYPTITMLDVGQGDSTLITLPNNKGNILIDTGGIINFTKEEWKKTKEYSISKRITIPYLKSIGINQIDYLVLTHGDSDHIIETINLINNYKIKNVILNNGNMNKNEIDIIEKLKKKNINYLTVSEYSLVIDKYKFYFINKLNNKNENKDSLIMYTNLNNYSLLFMADAESENEKYILESYNISEIDILKVSHHGSKKNTSQDFIEKINPQISLISVGRRNLFNHPHQETLNLLKNSRVYLTNINGSIKIHLNKKIKIKSCI